MLVNIRHMEWYLMWYHKWAWPPARDVIIQSRYYEIEFLGHYTKLPIICIYFFTFSPNLMPAKCSHYTVSRKRCTYYTTMTVIALRSANKQTDGRIMLTSAWMSSWRVAASWASAFLVANRRLLGQKLRNAAIGLTGKKHFVIVQKKCCQMLQTWWLIRSIVVNLQQ